MMTPKQIRFVHEYLIDLNATQAAIRAGYSAKTAAEIGHRLLMNVQVTAAIQSKQHARFHRLDLSADRVIQELARVGLSKLTDVMGWGNESFDVKDSNELPEAHSAAIESVQREERYDKDGGKTISFKVKMHDKVAALTLLGKHLKLFTERQELTGELEVSLREAKETLAHKLATLDARSGSDHGEPNPSGSPGAPA